jgi:large subunit ribosomal protein L24|tara:strand:+ start:315 stop:788 length:474 start_codon:yes stop_codon:yes gene_type:complete
MKTKWNKNWTASKQPRRQRKYRFNAPLHIKQKFLNVSLAPTLRKKYGMRQTRVRSGDSVKVLRGQFSGKTGKVENVSVKRTSVYLTGIEMLKKDGSKSLYPLQPSNLQIQEVDLTDKLRRAKLEGDSKGSTAKVSPTKDKAPAAKPKKEIKKEESSK